MLKVKLKQKMRSTNTSATKEDLEAKTKLTDLMMKISQAIYSQAWAAQEAPKLMIGSWRWCWNWWWKILECGFSPHPTLSFEGGILMIDF